MRDLIIDIFGVYTPEIVTLNTGIDTFKEVTVLDFPYIFGVLLFALTLYSLFRILGILVGGK